MVEMTTKELSEKLCIEYTTAAGLIQFLLDKGIAKSAGYRPKPAGQRGKGSNLYKIPTGPITITLVN